MPHNIKQSATLRISSRSSTSRLQQLAMAYNKPGGSFRLATRPRNVEEITKAAQSYEYSALVPLRYWLRAAGTMLKEVKQPPRFTLF